MSHLRRIAAELGKSGPQGILHALGSAESHRLRTPDRAASKDAWDHLSQALLPQLEGLFLGSAAARSRGAASASAPAPASTPHHTLQQTAIAALSHYGAMRTPLASKRLEDALLKAAAGQGGSPSLRHGELARCLRYAISAGCAASAVAPLLSCKRVSPQRSSSEAGADTAALAVALFDLGMPDDALRVLSGLDETHLLPSVPPHDFMMLAKQCARISSPRSPSDATATPATTRKLRDATRRLLGFANKRIASDGHHAPCLSGALMNYADAVAVYSAAHPNCQVGIEAARKLLSFAASLIATRSEISAPHGSALEPLAPTPAAPGAFYDKLGLLLLSPESIAALLARVADVPPAGNTPLLTTPEFLGYWSAVHRTILGWLQQHAGGVGGGERGGAAVPPQRPSGEAPALFASEVEAVVAFLYGGAKILSGRHCDDSIMGERVPISLSKAFLLTRRETRGRRGGGGRDGATPTRGVGGRDGAPPARPTGSEEGMGKRAEEAPQAQPDGGVELAGGGGGGGGGDGVYGGALHPVTPTPPAGWSQLDGVMLAYISAMPRQRRRRRLPDGAVPPPTATTTPSSSSSAPPAIQTFASNTLIKRRGAFLSLSEGEGREDGIGKISSPPPPPPPPLPTTHPGPGGLRALQEDLPVADVDQPGNISSPPSFGFLLEEGEAAASVFSAIQLGVGVLEGLLGARGGCAGMSLPALRRMCIALPVAGIRAEEILIRHLLPAIASPATPTPEWDFRFGGQLAWAFSSAALLTAEAAGERGSTPTPPGLWRGAGGGGPAPPQGGASHFSDFCAAWLRLSRRSLGAKGGWEQGVQRPRGWCPFVGAMQLRDVHRMWIGAFARVPQHRFIPVAHSSGPPPAAGGKGGKGGKGGGGEHHPASPPMGWEDLMHALVALGGVTPGRAGAENDGVRRSRQPDTPTPPKKPPRRARGRGGGGGGGGATPPAAPAARGVGGPGVTSALRDLMDAWCDQAVFAPFPASLEVILLVGQARVAGVLAPEDLSDAFVRRVAGHAVRGGEGALARCRGWDLAALLCTMHAFGSVWTEGYTKLLHMLLRKLNVRGTPGSSPDAGVYQDELPESVIRLVLTVFSERLNVPPAAPADVEVEDRDGRTESPSLPLLLRRLRRSALVPDLSVEVADSVLLGELNCPRRRVAPDSHPSGIHPAAPPPGFRIRSRLM